MTQKGRELRMTRGLTHENRPDESAVRYKMDESRWHLARLAELQAPVINSILHNLERAQPPAEVLFPFKCCLSAFLSSTASTLFYLRLALKREFIPWLEAKNDEPLFRAFYFARNFEVHQNVTTTSTVRRLAGKPKEPCVGLNFHQLAPLGAVRLHYATDCLLELAQQYLEAIEQAVNEATAFGHFR